MSQFEWALAVYIFSLSYNYINIRLFNRTRNLVETKIGANAVTFIPGFNTVVCFVFIVLGVIVFIGFILEKLNIWGDVFDKGKKEWKV